MIRGTDAERIDDLYEGCVVLSIGKLATYNGPNHQKGNWQNYYDHL